MLAGEHIIASFFRPATIASVYEESSNEEKKTPPVSQNRAKAFFGVLGCILSWKEGDFDTKEERRAYRFQ